MSPVFWFVFGAVNIPDKTGTLFLSMIRRSLFADYRLALARLGRLADGDAMRLISALFSDLKRFDHQELLSVTGSSTVTSQFHRQNLNVNSFFKN